MGETKFYSAFEEKLNIRSHAVGLVLSVVALVLLIIQAMRYGTALHIVSAGIFGASLIILYAASVAYHNSKRASRRNQLRVVDHAAIYVLIAGTYTPFALVTLNGATGWVLFGVTWGMAVVGITLKLFFTGRYELFSTLMYLLMGWVVVFAIKPLVNNLSAEGLAWLVVGGLSYTLGAVIYGIKRIRLNHAIFHSFVLVGSACHVMAVLLHVLPKSV